MNEMPRYSRWRPHFMKPGPYVEIAKEKPASFDDVKVNDDDDGEPSGFNYYPSEKVLGKLFDAIDEQKIFQRIQHNSSQHALHGVIMVGIRTVHFFKVCGIICKEASQLLNGVFT